MNSTEVAEVVLIAVGVDVGAVEAGGGDEGWKEGEEERGEGWLYSHVGRTFPV